MRRPKNLVDLTKSNPLVNQVHTSYVPSDKDLGPDDPILMGINEWLAFADESTEEEVEEILETGRSTMEKVTPNPAKDSEEAYQNSEQGGVVRELDKEESRRQETEELKKSIPVQYQDYLDVFSPGEARTLPPHRPWKLYNMSEKELKSLKEYIDEMLGKGFIRSSSSPAGAPVLFAKKKDGRMLPPRFNSS
ncbi:retrotransposon nucleocapsid protein [Lentinula edodes]|uniref:Retrotransposon nucleocapsid protein n=1 Tax=Lentinula edodes TaxID=5353 RepID=A0A1Q3EQG5_LENED|nr:retrotransposon nucleocapsid protein [Lentinula edodes]